MYSDSLGLLERYAAIDEPVRVALTSKLAPVGDEGRFLWIQPCTKIILTASIFHSKSHRNVLKRKGRKKELPRGSDIPIQRFSFFASFFSFFLRILRPRVNNPWAAVEEEKERRDLRKKKKTEEDETKKEGTLAKVFLPALPSFLLVLSFKLSQRYLLLQIFHWFSIMNRKRKKDRKRKRKEREPV